MKSVNSVSGGQTSAYLMKHFPADYNIFALVRIEDPACAPKDPAIKKYVESKIEEEFIATLEDDTIFYTLMDLEQFTGQRIDWVKNDTFDAILKKQKILPGKLKRFCTADMKVKPIAQWVVDNIGEVVDMRLGFRANEMRRAERAIAAHNECGVRTEKLPVGKHKNGNIKWHEFSYSKNSFPLIDNGIFKDQIVDYWKDKPVRFAERNNCVTCFHRNPLLLKLMSEKFPEKYAWAERTEKKAQQHVSKSGRKYDWNTWRDDGTYDQFRKHKTQLTLDDLDGFNECDSGYCGL